MTRSYRAYLVLVGAVVVERAIELVVSRRHARVQLARGGVEHGAGLYPSMVALHGALLAGCVVEPLVLRRPFVPALGAPMLILELAAQALRWWAIGALGVCWSTRVIVVPGGRRVADGPYRWFRHPNYLAVVVEGVALPLVHGAWITAAVFTILDAFVLRRRLRTENAALTLLRAA